MPKGRKPSSSRSDRVKTTITLPAYIMEKLEEYANKKSLSKGVVIQLALEEFFKKEEE